MRAALIGPTAEMSDIEVGRFFVQKHIFVNMHQEEDKFNSLCLMIEKLYAVVAGECELDNLDSPANQEVLLSGHLYGALLAEKLQDLLLGAKGKLMRDLRNPKFDSLQIRNPNYIRKMIDSQVSIGNKMEHFLATGNLISRTNLDLMQTAGYTIVADKLNNHRYLSHFRSIHRGQYFAEMKTTTVRKLLPEGWGFLCPVHTPDGGPCGLLNHITSACVPMAKEDKNFQLDRKLLGNFKALLASIGMHAAQSDFGLIYPHKYLPVTLDGMLLGYIDPKEAPEFVKALRALKIQQLNTTELYESVPTTLEVAYLPPTGEEGEEEQSEEQSSKKRGQKNKFFPGVFLASTVARFVRPVRNLEIGGTEWIGPLEQLNLSIACQAEDIRSDTTHQELDPINMLSMIATMQPFPEYNQSPRNMYQC